MTQETSANKFSSALAWVGGVACEQGRAVRYLAAVFGVLMVLSAQPARWRRTVRQVFARQLYFSGAQAVRFVIVVAVLVGLTVVLQAHVLTQRVGQSRMLGPLLVSVVARELGPMLVNLILIVRSGSAIVAEMGLMKAGGEVRTLEAQGLDPLWYLAMPRVMALVVAAFGLTAFFIPVAFASGYGFGAFFGQVSVDPVVFLGGVFDALRPADAVSILLKSGLSAALTGVICVTEGLSVNRAVTEVPIAVKRALARSLGTFFIVSAAISLLAYL